MTVSDLIAKLQQFPADMPVVVSKYEDGDAWFPPVGLSTVLAGRAGDVDFRLAQRSSGPYLDILLID